MKLSINGVMFQRNESIRMLGIGSLKRSESLKKYGYIRQLFLVSVFIIPGFQASADANVTCASGTTITNTTVFGGSYTTSNICGDNVTITTSGSKTIGGGNETNNTNGIYFAMNGPHPAFTFGDYLKVTVAGNYVDAIRTNGISATNGVYTIITGNNTSLIATGARAIG